MSEAKEKKEQSLALFQNKMIRQVWHKDQWFFSIVDIIEILADSKNSRTATFYWSTLKKRLAAEGFEEETWGIEKLKLPGADKRLRETDVANRETILRLVQSIPSRKAEPFRQWLAQVGEQRLEEVEEPELALERLKQDYRMRGYTEEWITLRIRNLVNRNDLTDEWRERGAIEGPQFATLTNIISEQTFGKTLAEHKAIKSLAARHNIRDHMTGLELTLSTLGEETTKELHRRQNTQGYENLKGDARRGGQAAGRARMEIEKELGGPVVSSQNFLDQPKTSAKNKKKLVEPSESQPSLWGDDEITDQH